MDRDACAAESQRALAAKLFDLFDEINRCTLEGDRAVHNPAIGEALDERLFGAECLLVELDGVVGFSASEVRNNVDRHSESLDGGTECDFDAIGEHITDFRDVGGRGLDASEDVRDGYLGVVGIRDNG